MCILLQLFFCWNNKKICLKPKIAIILVILTISFYQCRLVLRSENIRHIKRRISEKFPSSQILEADDCDTIAERQKVLLAKLAGVIEPHDLCYINDLLRIRFPLSDAYCIDSDKRREEKTISIFEAILKQVST